MKVTFPLKKVYSNVTSSENIKLTKRKIMKPTRNQFYCFDCGRTKMLFESQKKAENFIRFNRAEFEEEGKKVPVRAYYCEACGGWHVTSNPNENHFVSHSSDSRPLTRIGRIVEIKMKKHEHETFLRQKDELIAEALHLYSSHDYIGSIQKCHETLQLLKENGKEWWQDNRKVTQLMYEVICREATDIEKCLKQNDYCKAENILSHCNHVMEDLGETDGFEEYRNVLTQYLSQSIAKINQGRSEYLHYRTRVISARINEVWGDLMQNNYTRVKSEIDKYTTELITLSKSNSETSTLLPVVNKLYDLREAYRKRIYIAA